MGCTIKVLYDVKVTNSKLYGQNSSEIKGWCGLGRVQSLGDFDGLDAPRSQFLKPEIKHAVILGLTQLSKQNN